MSFLGTIHSKISRKYRYWRNDLRSNDRLYSDARGARILIYHGICLKDHTRYNAIFLREKTFEEQLKYYTKYFNVISLDDYYHQRFRDDKFNLCLTFDDGYANNHKYVLPLLEQYQVPATFFVTGIRDAGFDILWNDFLAIVNKHGPSKLEFNNEHFRKSRSGYVSEITGNSLKSLLHSAGFDAKKEMMQALPPFRKRDIDSDYWLQMTPEQINALSASPFVTIACHGYYHNDLSKIPIQQARNEMLQSRQYLESITGKAINAIAFPYGSYSPAVITEAKSLGFKQLLAMDFLYPEDYTDPAMRERLTMNPFISVHNQLYAIISGKYE